MSVAFGLTEKQLHEIRGVCIQHPSVKQVLVFGSRSLGRHREGSDLDLCLMDGDMPFSELLQLKAQLDDLNLPIQCDVIRYSSIHNEELRAHIHRAGVDLLS